MDNKVTHFLLPCCTYYKKTSLVALSGTRDVTREPEKQEKRWTVCITKGRKEKGINSEVGARKKKEGGGRNMGAAGLRRNKAKHNGKQSARTAVIT